MAEPFIGEIRPVSFNFAPKGWALCNGQVLSIAQNQALFSLLGTTYGGNGQTTFALPDLRSRVPLHFSAATPLGSRAGEENHTLTVSEMPTHNHLLNASTGAGNALTPAGALPAAVKEGSSLYATGTPNAQLNSGTVAQAGSNQPHPNLPPYLVINYVIALVGIYPSRT